MSPASTPSLTQQPHSLEAEKNVLGAVLLDPEAMLRIRSQLRANDFYDPTYRTIYETCEKLFDERKPIDFTTVAVALEHNTKISEIGGSGFLATLPAAVPTSSNVEHYARLVRDRSAHRSLIEAGQKIIGLGNDTESPLEQAISAAQSELIKIADAQLPQSKQSLAEVAATIYEKSTDAQAGGDAFEKNRFFTGYSNIDSFFDGLEPDSFTVIAGRPSMGKTALMLNMGINAAVKDKKKVLFVSLEMSNEQLVSRVLSSKLRVSMSQIRRGNLVNEQFHRMGDIASEFKDVSFYLEDSVNTTVAEILAKAMLHKLEHGLDVVIIDYLQLIGRSALTPKNGNRVDQFSDISRELKALPRTLQVPVIVGSQMSRDSAKRPDKRPQLSDIRETGAIEQDADNIMMLHREGYYDPDLDDPDVTNVFIRKNRQGSVGVADLMFMKETTQFVPVDHKYGEEEPAL